MLPFAIDRREELAGQAVTHALLIGIDQYDHLDNLGAASHTAVRIFEWIVSADKQRRLHAPLATVTLLLSPTDEIGHHVDSVVASALGGCGASTKSTETPWACASGANIRSARDRMCQLVNDSENNSEIVDAGLAIYYFGGHGADLQRMDPIGFACDADVSGEPWRNAFDQLEFREQLMFGSQLTENATSGSTNCLFLYDCCRDRPPDMESKPPDQVIERQYSDITNGGPNITRQWCVLTATTATFSAWEPTQPIPVDPVYELPLSYFGHAFLRVVDWATAYADYNSFTWRRSVHGIGEDVHRAMSELTKHDGVGQGFRSDPNRYGSPENFTIAYSENAPTACVTICCEPDTLGESTSCDVMRRSGAEFGLEKSLAAPWQRKTEWCTFIQGQYKISTRSGQQNLEKTQILRPALLHWRWIIQHDEIAIHDPAD